MKHDPSDWFKESVTEGYHTLICKTPDGDKPLNIFIEPLATKDKAGLYIRINEDLDEHYKGKENDALFFMKWPEVKQRFPEVVSIVRGQGLEV